ncbi:butyrate kinase [Pseudobutyrivibrio sp. AR14]|uniref:butyrate kinase n=1 Tax=Pseudobutyrivibrio sp. AR14 TaxID=1520804 RepID=UPI000890C0BF|nr:butyrate kinase [Pseudobutyrivibrio sp. AR14]SCY37549.1 butyrate kinase [Pseudobutyrivibrio sp. AR14]
MSYRILTINPGSTSTKVGFFNGEKLEFSVNVSHDAEKLAEFASVSDQLPYRKEVILSELEKAGIDLATVDAYVGRGGGLLAVEGGTYEVGQVLLDHAKRGANGIQHPAQLGSQLANEFAKKYGKPAFVVNPPDTDEFIIEARMTGIKGVYRQSHLHALNLKETAIRHSQLNGVKYEDANYIVCHIGGGVSISAHRKGKMIDGNDIVTGDGPMAPTRCGSVPAAQIIRYAYDHPDKKETLSLTTKTGGFVSHLGTSDALDVFNRAEAGDKEAKLIWDTMTYQIIRYIGAMATVLHGQVNGILLGGGMVHNKKLVADITEACSWIAPVSAYPGEFELEAMAAGAIRVLDGVEAAKEYTGVPCWTPNELAE